MKFLHLVLIFFILLSPFSYAKGNKLDDQDKQAVQKMVKNLANKLFLLETTDYNSKKLQKELLAMMPDKIATESEYGLINKKEYIHFSIKLAINRKARVDRIIQDDVAPLCHYIEDGTVDCDLKERIKIIEKNDRIPQKSFEYEAGTEYKFNLKMNETGDWYINKMKNWNMVPAPRMSTLKIEEKHRKEVLKKLNARDEDDRVRKRPTRRPANALPYKMTEVELAEEEAEKEEREQQFQEYQEQLKNDTNKSFFDSRIKKNLNSNVASRGWTPSSYYNPYYASNYAIRYAENYNRSYRRFSNDCANFVSQALSAGGWRNDWGWYSSSSAWWYNSNGQSYTWAGARNLHEYIDYQVQMRDNVEWKIAWWRDLRYGDVVALTLSSTSNRASHMMMVTSFHNGEIYLSGHTRDRKNRPLSEIDPRSRYYGWGYHIKYGNLQ